ncbi:MAG: hypothetical protein Greene041619_654 [Candidatus Peregrinibacteria bacterium Greene0416_19]|nr:MAG: hypothetical protein Greene041619_654 [Candidatus Peregrinibacteria bacterium Greene0416_19]
MNQSELRSLMDMIRLSTLLNDAERREWLQTLELYSDAELDQLYQIFADSQAVEPASELGHWRQALRETESIAREFTAPLSAITHV